MKILVSISSGSNNTERNILRAFFDGIEKYYFEKYQVDTYKVLKKQFDVDVRLSYDPEIEKCDIAIQFGTTKDRLSEHHVTKQSIQKNAKTVVYIETPVLGRVINEKNNYAYYRVGVNGFLNNDGVFFNEESFNKNRLQELKQKLAIPEFPGWKNHREGNILVLCQLPGDSSLRGQKMSEWLIDTVDALRMQTTRPISIRLHPAMSHKGRAEFISELGPVLFKNYQNVYWYDGTETSLQSDLDSAGICVTYSSGSAIDAVLSGVPVLALDEGNLAYPISSHRLDDLDNPKLASTEQINEWLIALANSQWNEREMLDGRVWNHLQSILDKIINTNENSNDLS
jgi:hypothetical protein